jgi:hypothetical protein
MAWITHTRECRSCGSTDFMRYHRKRWMRLFKGSQFLRCRQCRSTILLLPESRRRDHSGTRQA